MLGSAFVAQPTPHYHSLLLLGLVSFLCVAAVMCMCALCVYGRS